MSTSPAASPRKKATRPDQPDSGAASGDTIYERILGAIMEHRLAPGTKLVEEKLAGIFGVNRTRVREVLARLAHEGLIITIPNRGAFVASPTPEEARQIFAARRMVEPALLRHLCEHTRPDHISRLRAHVEDEARARASNDRRAIIRLSGEFHLRMADMAGNAVMSKMMRELVSLTCLIIVLYDSPTAPACTHDEHGAIIDAIAEGRTDDAVATMLAHLHHIESVLDMSPPQGDGEDLEAMLGLI